MPVRGLLHLDQMAHRPPDGLLRRTEVHTLCAQCDKDKVKSEERSDSEAENPADKKRAQQRFLEDALKKLAKKA